MEKPTITNKIAYTSPELVEYGDIYALTKGTSGAGTDPGGGTSYPL